MFVLLHVWQMNLDSVTDHLWRMIMEMLLAQYTTDGKKQVDVRANGIPIKRITHVFMLEKVRGQQIGMVIVVKRQAILTDVVCATAPILVLDAMVSKTA